MEALPWVLGNAIPKLFTGACISGKQRPNMRGTMIILGNRENEKSRV